MSFEDALRATEILLAWAFIQQSCEHLRGSRRDKILFGARLVLCLGLMAGVYTGMVLAALLALNLVILNRFQGPYNGGSDRMGGLILASLTVTYAMPTLVWQERAFSYLALQLTLSYFISGKVKITNPDWRSGVALSDVFAFSAYPVSEEMRALSSQTRLLWVMSWAVILFELLFPLALISYPTLIVALIIAATFHLANACLFGLNRFFWTWLAAYPSLLWLQGRLLGG